MSRKVELMGRAKADWTDMWGISDTEFKLKARNGGTIVKIRSNRNNRNQIKQGKETLIYKTEREIKGDYRPNTFEVHILQSMRWL